MKNDIIEGAKGIIGDIISGVRKGNSKDASQKGLLPNIADTMHTGEDASQDPFELLKSQHQEVDSLFNEFDHTGKGAARGRKQIIEEIYQKLTCHAKMEEIIFYPQAKKADEDLTLEATEEHGMVKILLGQVRTMTPTDKTLIAKMKVLKEMVQHHVKEEENEMFEKMRAKFSKAQLETLGVQMKEEFDRLLERMQKGAKASKAKARAGASAGAAKRGASSGASGRSASARKPATKTQAKAPAKAAAKTSSAKSRSSAASMQR